jgi:hypothetical protein
MFTQMVDFDYAIRKHHETTRRSEQRFALLEGLDRTETVTAETKPRRLSIFLRRIAGSPAAA